MGGSKLNEVAASLLREWLLGRLDAPQRGWLDGQIDTLVGSASDAALHVAFGMAPRRLGKADLALSDADRAAAHRALPGWDPQGWSVADSARVLLLSQVSSTAPDFAQLFRSLCATADAVELTALYRGLPLYAQGETLLDQVGEGLRSNMRGVNNLIIE